MNLAEEISAFDAMLPTLRATHREVWVVIVGTECEGNFPSFEAAAAFAVEHFPGQEFLIRPTEAKVAQIPFVVVENTAAHPPSQRARRAIDSRPTAS